MELANMLIDIEQIITKMQIEKKMVCYFLKNHKKGRAVALPHFIQSVRH